MNLSHTSFELKPHNIVKTFKIEANIIDKLLVIKYVLILY